jgi:type IV pilus assembly protein PilQ
MKIKPEVSNVESNLTYQIAAQVNNTVPVVSSTTAETNVMVKDGTTIIIGGLRKDQKLKTVNRLPVLGDLPLIGAAFRNKSDSLEKDEIVVFITPHIISGDTPASDEGLKPKGIRE